MKKILLLNGPPRSGKDTMAEWFEERGFTHLKFSKLLKERTHLLYGLGDLPHDHFEDKKDDPLPQFYGISPRDAYINLSEDLMKPNHGDSIWACILADFLTSVEDDYIVISDLGFQVEWEVFMQRFGYDKLTLVQIHRDGCNFNNDSREWVLPRGPFKYVSAQSVIKDQNEFNEYMAENWFEISNGGTIEDLYKECDVIYNVVVDGGKKPRKSEGRTIGSVSNVSIAG